MKQQGPEPPPEVDEVLTRPGTKPGYSEILFPARPDETTRAKLKAAGYRWNPKKRVWWGPTHDLPAL